LNRHSAYLSLGSNIEPEANIRSAMSALKADFDDVAFSPAYRCPAVGFKGDDFINLAACINTRLKPLELRHYLAELENRHKRDRLAPRWSSRTLDIDILLYDDLYLMSPALEIPRKEILTTAHVLKPLADLAPELLHPLVQRTIALIWKDFPKNEVSLSPVVL
jgi:2-amino-4-hydroxy-6-hydroxymethyldihydropteridine diphosphokinase